MEVNITIFEFDHGRGPESSSPRESHPQALTDPDVSLSAHPAPIVQPEDACRASANGQTTGVAEELRGLTSTSLSVAVL